MLASSSFSNVANIRQMGDGTIKAGQYWLNTTNVSGKSAYAMTMFDTRVLCNPTAASCTITAPASDNVGWVLPTAAVPFRGWGAQNGYVAGGTPLEAKWLTTTYEIENLGSNTANTVTVSLPNAATNWGGSSLVIPNQMGLRMHYGGTNNVNAGYISAELYALSPAPTYNLANCTNIPAGNLAGNIPTAQVTNIFNGSTSLNAGGLTNQQSFPVAWANCNNNTIGTTSSATYYQAMGGVGASGTERYCQVAVNAQTLSLLTFAYQGEGVGSILAGTNLYVIVRTNGVFCCGVTNFGPVSTSVPSYVTNNLNITVTNGTLVSFLVTNNSSGSLTGNEFNIVLYGHN